MERISDKEIIAAVGRRRWRKWLNWKKAVKKRNKYSRMLRRRQQTHHTRFVANHMHNSKYHTVLQNAERDRGKLRRQIARLVKPEVAKKPEK